MTTDLSFERAFENDKFYSHALNRACYEEVVGGRYGSWNEDQQRRNLEKMANSEFPKDLCR